jgi:hypothetical protein
MLCFSALPPDRGRWSPDTQDMWNRQEEPPGTRRAGGSEARRPRGATPAGGRHPLQPVDPSAPREVTEAFEGGSSLNAGLTEAGFSSGDEAVDPPRQHRQEAGVLSRVGATSLQPGRSEAVRRFPTHGTAPTSTWRDARMRSFEAGGGVVVQFAGSAAGAAFEEPSPEEALEVSGEAVYALFGSLRASPLRMIGLPMQVDRQKEWKLRNAQK